MGRVEQKIEKANDAIGRSSKSSIGIRLLSLASSQENFAAGT